MDLHLNKTSKTAEMGSNSAGSSGATTESSTPSFPHSPPTSALHQMGSSSKIPSQQTPINSPAVVHYTYSPGYSPMMVNWYGQMVPLGHLNSHSLLSYPLPQIAPQTSTNHLPANDVNRVRVDPVKDAHVAHFASRAEGDSLAHSPNTSNRNGEYHALADYQEATPEVKPAAEAKQSVQDSNAASRGHPLSSASTPYSANSYKPHSTSPQSHLLLPENASISRLRRKSTSKVVNDVKYPMNYPAHPVPAEFQVISRSPSEWNIVPPRPEDIKTRRYATGVDERNYFTVLEYEINNQSIIWDYYTGYVHLTGIWKALGNPKADIVKLLDSSPELEPLIKRVRGGFLKIQGTWVPFETARALAKHACYYLRFALIPLFGPEFPSQCTQPHESGFGTLQLTIPTDADSNRPPQLSSLQPSQISPNSQANQKGNALESLISADTVSKPRSLTGQAGPQKEYQHIYPRTHSKPYVSPRNHHRPLNEGRFNINNRHEYRLKKRQSGSFSNSSPRARTYTVPSHLPTPTYLQREPFSQDFPSANAVYDEEVFEDDDRESSHIELASPPMPRKVSFSDEERVSESPVELLAMLKATRSLQQIKTGKLVKDTGGEFECAGRKFSWDGSDSLVSSEKSRGDLLLSSSSDVVSSLISATPPAQQRIPKPEPSPPIEH